MLKKLLGASLVFALTFAIALPFAREMYDRHLIAQRLGGVLDARDRVALDNWSGSARSFVDSLYDRCVRTNGGGSPQCERYRTAVQ